MNKTNVEERKIQMWKGNILMTLINESEVKDIVKNLENTGYWVSYQEGSSHFTYEEKKPYCLMTKEEQKQIRKSKGKVICKHCNHKQFYRNEQRCRYCFNINQEWEGNI